MNVSKELIGLEDLKSNHHYRQHYQQQWLRDSYQHVPIQTAQKTLFDENSKQIFDWNEKHETNLDPIELIRVNRIDQTLRRSSSKNSPRRNVSAKIFPHLKTDHQYQTSRNEFGIPFKSSINTEQRLPW